MDYALSSGGGNLASTSPTTVETVQITNGVQSCGNGVPSGTTANNNDCNAIGVSTQDGAMNTGARAPSREPPLAARSVPGNDCVQQTSPPPLPPREVVLDGWG